MSTRGTPVYGVSEPKNSLTSLAPGSGSSSSYGSSSTKSRGARGFIAGLIGFLIVLFLLYIFKPDIVTYEDNPLVINNGKLFGWSLLAGILIGLIAALAA